MARCSTCKTPILFGGKPDGALRFCNTRCHGKYQTSHAQEPIQQHLLENYLRDVHSGPCPQCKGVGPNDVHSSHQIWSAIFASTWSTRPDICCNGCGVKNKFQSMGFSLLLGWWGFPWGLIVTPIILIRNVIGFFELTDPRQPSKQMEEFVRVSMATQNLPVSGGRL